MCAKAPTDRTMMAKECRVWTNSSCKEDNRTDCGRVRWKRRKVSEKHQHWNRAIVKQCAHFVCTHEGSPLVVTALQGSDRTHTLSAKSEGCVSHWC